MLNVRLTRLFIVTLHSHPEWGNRMRSDEGPLSPNAIVTCWLSVLYSRLHNLSPHNMMMVWEHLVSSPVESNPYSETHVRKASPAEIRQAEYSGENNP